MALGALFLPGLAKAATRPANLQDVGLQLYSVRENMLADATGTLKQLAKIGYKELESAMSEKGAYYGLEPKEIKKLTQDLGMTLRSGHVHISDDWQRTVDNAAETGQEYLVCSSMPSKGQTIANYQHAAEVFNRAAEDCKKAGLQFGYHNHDYEFEKDNGQVLYDVLIENTDPDLVKMEMDIGWLVLSGYDPIVYFDKYPGRFPLWHLKDMSKAKKHSTEFGKGDIAIKKMLQNADKSKMKYYFVEQEEYSGAAMDAMKYDYNYLQKLSLK